ncbi:MlaD family protein [Synechococcus sp. PCC 7336]|uniref:MlaD family protein n=1 Tax=Synechococcus sp. PCC 7336 TaxID=195250 RepID=UPI00034625AF|nr:MlaD family protein [Synechococcus sp. PCC 7336]
MRSRVIREGLLGLLILSGILGLAGLFFWVLNFRVGERGYRFTVTFEDAGGLLDGAAVRLRGVEVGRVQGIATDVDAVRVRVAVDRDRTIVPLASQFLASQTGLIGETTLDIVPDPELEPIVIGENRGPLDEQCDIATIVCDGMEVTGSIGVSYSQLVQKMDRLLSTFADGEFDDTINRVASSVTEVADSVTELADSLQSELDFAAISNAAQSVDRAANTLSTSLSSNQASLNSAIADLSVFSQDMREITTALKPFLASEELTRDLGAVTSQAAIASENVAAVTADLRLLTENFSDPQAIADLRATLDSARVTFENAQKITTDLNELTGDAEFRQSLRELVLGLNDLVSAQPLLPGETQPTVTQTPPLRYGFTPVSQADWAILSNGEIEIH